jgi:hypothetical protein
MLWKHPQHRWNSLCSFSSMNVSLFILWNDGSNHIFTWRPRFMFRSVHVGFVTDKVALGQVFLQVLWFSCQCHSTVSQHTHVSPRGWTIGSMVTVVQRHSLTPVTWTTTIMYSNFPRFSIKKLFDHKRMTRRFMKQNWDIPLDLKNVFAYCVDMSKLLFSGLWHFL